LKNANEGGRSEKKDDLVASLKLKPPKVSGGVWTEITLHKFGAKYYDDGSAAQGLILIDGKGLYGATGRGGTADTGTVFNLSFVP
jgi:hypothetical protein